MTRLNGGVLLPQHEAAAKQQEALLNLQRLQVAAMIAGHLLPQQLAAQAAHARRAAGIDGEGVTFDAAEAIDQAANLAIAAADALLVKLGLVGQA